MSIEQTRERFNIQLGTALAKRALCDEEITTVRAVLQGFNSGVATAAADAAKAEEETELEE